MATHLDQLASKQVPRLLKSGPSTAAGHELRRRGARKLPHLKEMGLYYRHQ